MICALLFTKYNISSSFSFFILFFFYFSLLGLPSTGIMSSRHECCTLQGMCLCFSEIYFQFICVSFLLVSSVCVRRAPARIFIYISKNSFIVILFYIFFEISEICDMKFKYFNSIQMPCFL